jgi:hypothetical protein
VTSGEAAAVQTDRCHAWGRHWPLQSLLLLLLLL